MHHQGHQAQHTLGFRNVAAPAVQVEARCKKVGEVAHLPARVDNMKMKILLSSALKSFSMRPLHNKHNVLVYSKCGRSTSPLSQVA